MTIDTKAIRARAEAASPGPWRLTVEALRPRVNCEVISDRDDAAVCSFERSDPPDPNAEFVWAASFDVPALCDEVEQLRAAITQALGQLESMTTWPVADLNEPIVTLREALGVEVGP